jgi:phage terminase large subunit-like protein
MWDTSCVDWEARIRAGRSLIPKLPLIESEADIGLQFFDELQLPDQPGLPRMRDAAGQWFRDIVRVAFGSWDPVARVRYIRDIFAMLPKGQSKTTYSAGLLLVGMLMNRRPRAEALFVGPTQAIADNAYDKATGMIEASVDLKRRFRTRDHVKTIEDLVTGSELRVKTFDVNILTGSILFLALVDELHLLGRLPYAAKVLRQIRGGLEKTQEGLLLITTTASDDIPAGVMKDELAMARGIRDGRFKDREVRSMLPIIYEFPADIAKDQDKWSNPVNWPMVMPNLGRSMHLTSLIPDWETEKSKNEQAKRIWASQHLNIEIGIGLKSESWAGAEFWSTSEDEKVLRLDDLIARCEAIVIGLDGGGLDDLFGFAALGRERETKRWLLWSHAWCHRKVLERRKAIASLLEDFEKLGDLTFIDSADQDILAVVDLIAKVNDAGLLAAVAIDNEGPYGELVDELDKIGVNEASEQIVGIGQGWRLMRAIKTTERKLENGSLLHSPSALMNWCVGNVKIEAGRSGIAATKQSAGDAKVDPVFALWDAADVMIRNPEPKGARGILEFYRAASEAAKSPAVATVAAGSKKEICLRAPAGISNVSSMSGRQYIVGADGTIEVDEQDSASLIDIGFERVSSVALATT